MQKQRVIRHFKGVRNLAKALKVGKSAIYQWPDPIPEGRAYQLELMTEGQLKVDPAVYEKQKQA